MYNLTKPQVLKFKTLIDKGISDDKIRQTINHWFKRTIKEENFPKVKEYIINETTQ